MANMIGSIRLVLFSVLFWQFVACTPVQPDASDEPSEKEPALLLVPEPSEDANLHRDAPELPLASNLHCGASELPLDPNLHCGALANGLRYFIYQRGANTTLEAASGNGAGSDAQDESLALRLVVHTGSRDEAEPQPGYAHFVEHAAFLGSENLSHHRVVETFREQGMEIGHGLNVFTEYDQTYYILDFHQNSVQKRRLGLQVLRDWAAGIRFDPAAIEAEKEVIKQEYRQRGEHLQRVDQQLQDWLNYGDQGAVRVPIEMLDSVDKVTASSLRNYYQRRYTPQNMMLIAVSSAPWEELAGEIEAHFGALRAAPASGDAETGRALGTAGATLDGAVTSPLAGRAATALRLTGVDRTSDFANRILVREHRLPQRSEQVLETVKQQIGLSLYLYLLNQYIEREQRIEPFGMDRPQYGHGLDIYRIYFPVERGNYLSGARAYRVVERDIRAHGFSQEAFQRVRNRYLRGLVERYHRQLNETNWALANRLLAHANGQQNFYTQQYWKTLIELSERLALPEVERALLDYFDRSHTVYTFEAASERAHALPQQAVIEDFLSDHWLSELAAPAIATQ